MTVHKNNYMSPVTIITFLTLLVTLTATSQKCSSPSLTDTEPQCPSNSHCNNNYCVCERGYFGDCTPHGEYINSEQKEFQINENISYFLIEPSVNEFVSFQFVLCNEGGEKNDELLNLWVDDGNMVTPTQKNALGNDKSIRVDEGCLALVTSFFSFTLQPNGQRSTLIFGIKLQNPGSIKIKLLVTQIELFGFDIIFRIILILVSGIVIISLAAIIYCIYKCRRRSAALIQQRNDIAFFDEFMPAQKAKLQDVKEEICSVCLTQFKENQEMRLTVCSHYFHKSCLDEWCVTNLNCPICRTSFEKADLVHNQYMLSRRDSTSAAHQSQLMQNGIINGETNLRQPII